MTYNINQLSYQEGVFQFDNDIYKSGQNVSVSINPVMRIAEDSDAFLVLQLTVTYSMEEEIIMKYGGLAIYMVDGLKDLIANDSSFNGFKVVIWEQALQFFRGIICEKLRGTPIEHVFLPMLRREDIITIKLEVKKDSKDL